MSMTVAKEIRVTEPYTDSRKRRRQGEAHYPVSKKQDVGSVRVTEITSDIENSDKDRVQSDISGSNSNSEDSGKE